MAIIPGTLLSLCLSTAKGIRNLVQVAQNRRQVRDLAQWDDRALKDIGLTRSDIAGALSLPLRDDPTLHLASLSGRSPRMAGEETLRTGTTRAVKPEHSLPGLPPSARPAFSA